MLNSSVSLSFKFFSVSIIFHICNLLKVVAIFFIGNFNILERIEI
ncbi:hypothetical protein AEQU1_01410 [Aequorivita sp. CIP111184]|nr:hypothetical protein AEQU1_01410 [Aequorivita sp. CIP111184]